MEKVFNYRAIEKSVCSECGKEFIPIPKYLSYITKDFGCKEQKYFFMPFCNCFSEKMDKEKEDEIQEEVKKVMEENKKKSIENFNKKYKEISVQDKKFEKEKFSEEMEMDKYEKTLFKYAKSLVEKPEHQGVMLYGSVGTGKTTLMARVANFLLENKKTVLFISLKNYLNTLKSDIENSSKLEEEMLKAVKDVDFLCLDDLGTEKYSVWVEEKLFSLIDTRYRVEKSLMITTNLNFSQDLNKCEFINKFDSKGRIRDRIIELCYPILVDGESKRKINRDKFKNFIEN